MSNLLKSKFLTGFVIVAALAVGVALAAPSNAQADCTITMTLRVGSVGAEVMCLQGKVGAVADGKFGPMTHLAVKTWQAAHGLVADGIVGPLTRAALMGAPTGNFPAGCTSAAGYSPITGVKCDTGTSTGLPAGCSSTAGYSPLTGVKCDSTPPPSGGGGDDSLDGGAGSLEAADFVSSLNDEEVGEDQEDVAVVGLDLMADDGSDLMINSVRVSFEEQGAGGSVDFDDYADSVSVWFEGDMVGEASVDDFNEDEDVWSKTITLDDGAIIDADDEGRLEVAVTALGGIDSSDLGSANNDWEVTIDNVRYEDGDGVVQTESDLDDIGDPRSFFFDSFASANDVELKVRKTSDTPDEQTVTVDEDGGDEVLLLSGEFEAEGSDVVIKSVTVNITPSGTGDASEIATRYMLKIGGEEVDSIDSDECEVPGDCDGTGTNTAVDYVFNDMDDQPVDEGDPIDFEIWAELDEISATFAEGDSLDASVNADDIDAEDESGEDLTGTELSGVANGEEQTFFSEGIMVDSFETSATRTFTADDAGEDSIGKFVVEFEVTANETEVYLDKSTDGSGVSGTNGEGVVYDVDGGTAPTVSATFECVASCGDTSDNTADEFYIAEGDTETYRLTVNVTSDVTDDYSVWIESINWDSADVAAATQFYTSNLGDDSDADTGSLQLISL